VNTVLVDSNVLLDIATEDKTWSAWSAQALEAVANEAPLAINVVIYGELSIGFSRIEDLELAIPLTLFRREAIPYETAFLAGKALGQYRRRGGVRVRLFPDFYIGVHAAVAGSRY
jgi:predicted nucleic acid-binding protein